MSIAQRIGAEIRRRGSSVTVQNGENSICERALVQPLRRAESLWRGHESVPEGLLTQSGYLFIGTASCPLEENSTVIIADGRKYLVRRREKYVVGDESVYVRAILTEFGEIREDEFDEHA